MTHPKLLGVICLIFINSGNTATDCLNGPITLVGEGGLCDGSKICNPSLRKPVTFVPEYWQGMAQTQHSVLRCSAGRCKFTYSTPDESVCADNMDCQSQRCVENRCVKPTAEPNKRGASCQLPFCQSELVCDVETKTCATKTVTNSAGAEAGERCSQSKFALIGTRPCKDQTATFCWNPKDDSSKGSCVARSQVDTECKLEGGTDTEFAYSDTYKPCVDGYKCTTQSNSSSTIGTCASAEPPSRISTEVGTTCNSNDYLGSATPLVCGKGNFPLVCTDDTMIAIGTIKLDGRADGPTACQNDLWWNQATRRCVTSVPCSRTADCYGSHPLLQHKKHRSLYYCDCSEKICKVADGFTFECSRSTVTSSLEEYCKAQESYESVHKDNSFPDNYEAQKQRHEQYGRAMSTVENAIDRCITGILPNSYDVAPPVASNVNSSPPWILVITLLVAGPVLLVSLLVVLCVVRKKKKKQKAAAKAQEPPTDPYTLTVYQYKDDGGTGYEYDEYDEYDEYGTGADYGAASAVQDYYSASTNYYEGT